MPRVSLTGIKPTGEVHLGNYVGAIRPALQLAESYQAYYFVADYHALINERDPARVREYTRAVAAAWLACGLDPERVTFYRQSDVPETLELAWILTCITPKGMLNRAHAYKAAVDRAGSVEAADAGVNMGLYNYPVLMAADILIMEADVVPVGVDQLQHVEYTRDLAERLNAWIGQEHSVRVPSTLAVTEQTTVAGLDGRKMSASYQNTIPMFADRQTLQRLVRRFKTDSAGLAEPKDPDTPIVALYELFADPTASADLRRRLVEGGTGWGQVKEELTERLDSVLAPMRASYLGYLADPAQLEAILQRGAVEARERAASVLDRVRRGVGVG